MALYITSLAGGILIGSAVSLLLLFNGRVTGVSGIVNSALSSNVTANLWRWSFLLGLLGGGFILKAVYPESLLNTLERSPLVTVTAGLLVGYGTVLGNGCTSGHGVCGISRLSRRSIFATATFIVFGCLTATVFRFLMGGS